MSEFGLSSAEKKWLNAIQELTRIEGYPPTRRELMRALGVGSLNSTEWAICSLEKKGRVVHDRTKSRGLSVARPLTDAERHITRGTVDTGDYCGEHGIMFFGAVCPFCKR